MISIKNIININYTENALLSTEEFVAWLRNTASIVSVDLLRVDLDVEKFQALIVASNLEIIPSSDGLISTVHDNGKNTDLSKSSRNFVLHTDGPYYTPPPQLVILQCKQAATPEHQIPTVLKDINAVIERFTDVERNILLSLQFVYHGRENTRIAQPLILYNAATKHWESYFGGKGHIECTDEATYDFFTWEKVAHTFIEQLQSNDIPLLRHNYQKHDLLIFNNRRYLHGRINETNSADTERTLHRIWLNQT